MLGARSFSGVGENPRTTIPIMKRFKRYTGKMKHYYMLSKNKTDFKIAVVEQKPGVSSIKTEKDKIIEFTNIDDLKNNFQFEKYSECIPYKDEWYVNHRFFQHPIYKYQVYGIPDKNSVVDAVFVMREERIEERIAVRIVDYLGNQQLFENMGSFFENLLNKQGYEYADFYCDGFDEEQIKKAGFKLLDDNDTNIIPNYFHPMVKENIDIWVSSTFDKALFTKADSDQDRPN